jgi:hypothetical protein
MKIAVLAVSLTVFLAGCAGTGSSSADLSATQQGSLALNATETAAAPSAADQKEQVSSTAIPQMAFLSLMIAF